MTHKEILPIEVMPRLFMARLKEHTRKATVGEIKAVARLAEIALKRKGYDVLNSVSIAGIKEMCDYYPSLFILDRHNVVECLVANPAVLKHKFYEVDREVIEALQIGLQLIGDI